MCKWFVCLAKGNTQRAVVSPAISVLGNEMCPGTFLSTEANWQVMDPSKHLHGQPGGCIESTEGK